MAETNPKTDVIIADSCGRSYLHAYSVTGEGLEAPLSKGYAGLSLDSTILSFEMQPIEETPFFQGVATIHTCNGKVEAKFRNLEGLSHYMKTRGIKNPTDLSGSWTAIHFEFGKVDGIEYLLPK